VKARKPAKAMVDERVRVKSRAFNLWKMDAVEVASYYTRSGNVR
jgi:hypothetical protein